MSLILDALKKLDREKKSSSRSGGADIAAEILRPDSDRPRGRIPLYLAAAALAAAFAVAYGVIGRPVPPPQSPSPASPATVSAPFPPAASSVQPAESVMKSTAPPPVSPSAPDPQAAATPPQRVQGRDARDETGGAPPQPTKQAASSKTSSPVEKGTARPESSKEAKAYQKAADKTAEPARRETAAAPPLKLSGILWYDNPLQRRAVINGMALPEGSVIEGVRVLEIHPARVRLSHNGRSYDIAMPQ